MSHTTIPTSLANIILAEAKCNEDNFQGWKSSMSMFFSAVGATHLTTDPLPDSVPADLVSLDKQITFYIFATLDADVRYLMDQKKSGLEAWKAVLGHFQRSNVGRRLQARQDLYRVTHDPFKPISAYIHAVDKAVQVLKGLSVDITETEHGDVLLMNLHESFSTVRATILSSKDEPALSSIKEVLSGSSVSAIPSLSIKQEPYDVMPAANVAQSGRRIRSTPSASPSGTVDIQGFRWCSPINEGHCFRCGRPGHVAHLCIADMPENIKDWVMKGRTPYSSALGREAAHFFEEVEVDSEVANNIIGFANIGVADAYDI